MNDNLCYLNGEYLPLNQAKVSVLDRGFVFGDGIYEVVPVYGKRLFRFDEHMARLQRSLNKVRIKNPLIREGWLERSRTLVAALAEKTGAFDQMVYIQVTRGVAPLAQGQRVGQLKVTTGSGTPVVNVPLTVLEPVPLAGIFGRAWDAVRLWIR